MREKLKPCPSPECNGPASFLYDSRPGCERCSMLGPFNDQDGAKWNALPRRTDASQGMSDGELIARAIWASAALRIVAAGEGDPNGSTQTLIDSLEDELDRRAAARKESK